MTTPKTYHYIEQFGPVHGLHDSVVMVVGRLDVSGVKDVATVLKYWQNRTPERWQCRVVKTGNEERVIRMRERA